ncbi:GNAT family N-acetyltransferase [Actinoplanes philippinensis]|uniref:GNAT family N-acetyltransferase n=1 Tax=Actinoplanes philippinensis TaxID=35752 RepID=UPI0033CA18EF
MTAGVRRVAGSPPEDDLLDLVRRCRAADGGMPLVTEPWFLRGRWLAAGTVAFEVREGGALVAAAAVRPSPGGPMISGLVDPAFRGRGVGASLLDAALAAAGSSGPQGEAGRGALPVTVECEGLTAGAAELFASRGLTQFFGEDVMRIKLASGGGCEAGWPDGAEVVEWSAETAGRFHAVYAASFRERPGFPDPAAEEWIEENTEDDDFRPQWSLMATLPGYGDVGFVTAAEGWIVQVGVVPAARGTGLGGALIRESLRRMAAAGATEAWLTVNVNNPSAAGLYRKLGFEDMGQRARYR